MAKKFLFALFLFALQLGTTPIFANVESITILESENCSAPAPDSFRITSIGTNFISLAWVPAWVGATHTLVVQESNGSGGWTTMSVFQNIPDSTYLVDSLEPGTSYRCILATECPNGDVSQFSTFIDIGTLIVDLTIQGRTPLKPNSPAKCNDIPLNVHWKGFRVVYSESASAIVNQFEIEVVGNSDIYIKRVGLFNSIVAVNSLSQQWPKCDDPNVSIYYDFMIARLINGGPEKEIAGVVEMSLNGNSIKICPVYNHPQYPWKNNYSFSGFTSEMSGTPQECIERGLASITQLEDIQAQSPFQQNLHIFLNQTQTEKEKLGISLTSLNGQVLFEQEYITPIQELEIPTANIPAGLYVLKINCDLGFKILKVLKVE